MIAPSGKSPVLALILSILVGGLGQLYIGQTVKGIVMLAISVILWVVAAITCFILSPIPIVFDIVIAIDAFIVARRLAAGQSVGAWKFF